MCRLDSDIYHHQIYLPVPKIPFLPLPAFSAFLSLAAASLGFFGGALAGWGLGGGVFGVLASFRTVWKGFGCCCEGADGLGLGLAVTCLRFGVVGDILGILDPRLGLFGQH